MTEDHGNFQKSFVEIWTDGGCSPNPGPGGWGVLLRFKGIERELSGGESETTNNRMELTAAAMALETLTRPCQVDLYTDSQYVRRGITEWLEGWKKNGWKNASKKAVANTDLWQRLENAAVQHQIKWHWVKGHNGCFENERVDQLATLARKKIQEKDGINN